MPVIVLSLIDCGGGPGHAEERGLGPCIASKVQEEAGPEWETQGYRQK